MTRKIILDVETTGFKAIDGDKIVEIACIELFDDKTLGKEFHYYINPKREIPRESTAIHNITNEMVADKPTFAEIAGSLVEFIGNSKIIAHNANFDKGFINHELNLANFPMFANEQFIDTLVLAKNKFPTLKNSLDALASRFNISLKSREGGHGALIDIKLLAEVYKNLINDQITSLDDLINKKSDINIVYNTLHTNKPALLPNKEDISAHNDMLKKYGFKEF
jgi:DNA polymerase-3 subunit epsilon